jgi:hypothetical protein
MMPGEMLGQLVTREVVRSRDAMDNACILEHHEIPVDRALRQAGLRAEDLGDRHGPGGGEHVDDLLASRRESLRIRPQQPRNGLVQ